MKTLITNYVFNAGAKTITFIDDYVLEQILLITNVSSGIIITNDGSPCIMQDYMPDVDGFVIMTEEQAIDWANIIMMRLQ